MALKIDYIDKDKNLIKETTTGFFESVVTVPLVQESFYECKNIVNEGDTVTEGQVIAEVSRDIYGSKALGGAKIHSPVPGKVTGIVNCSYPDGKNGKAVQIKLDGSFTYIGKAQKPFEWNNYSPSMLLRSISDSGVINTFDRDYSSLEIDINRIKDSEKRRLFVRLFDADPYCCTDSILAVTEFEKIMTGILITAKVSGVDEIIIGCEKKSPLFTKLSIEQKDFFGANPVTLMEIDNTLYPSGGKTEFVKSYRKQKKIGPKIDKIISSSLFTDSVTMVHVYNAVVLNIPVENVNVFVSGDCLQAKALLKVPVGTSFKSIAKQCGGFTKKLGKIIVNGAINGTAINSLDTPVTKYVKSISFNSKKDNIDRSEGICLRCGRCMSVCQAGLAPNVIYAKVISGIDIDKVYIESAMMCKGCGVCSAVCPSKLPLAKVIKLLKEKNND